MYQEWFKDYEKITGNINKLVFYNKSIRKVKKKIKALDKIIKLCKKNNLELTRGQNKELIIKGFFKLGDDKR